MVAAKSFQLNDNQLLANYKFGTKIECTDLLLQACTQRVVNNNCELVGYHGDHD